MWCFLWILDNWNPFSWLLGLYRSLIPVCPGRDVNREDGPSKIARRARKKMAGRQMLRIVAGASQESQ